MPWSPGGGAGPVKRIQRDVNRVEGRSRRSRSSTLGGPCFGSRLAHLWTDARTFFTATPGDASLDLGHEPVGVLDQVGDQPSCRRGVGRGPRVPGVHPYLRTVPMVHGRLSKPCQDHLYGYDPFPGASPNFAAVPPIALKNLIPLPEDLPSDLATVATPSPAPEWHRALDVRLGDTVVILGSVPSAAGRRSWPVTGGRPRCSSGREPGAVGSGPGGGRGVRGRRMGVAATTTAWRGESRTTGRAPTDQRGRPAKPASRLRWRWPPGGPARVFRRTAKHDGEPLDMNQLHYKELTVLGAYGATHRQ